MSLGGYFSTMHLMTTPWPASASSWAGGSLPVDELRFGFAAYGVRVFNSCSDRLFFNLSTQATTGNDFISGCSAMVLDKLPVAGYQEVTSLFLLTTTSSSTARPTVGISAWASA